MKTDSAIWRACASASGYEVSDDGRVRRSGASTELSQFNSGSGYPTVSTWLHGKRRNFSVHRLVAGAFCSRPEGTTQVNHIDGNKQRNCQANLEWCTPSQNSIHAVRVTRVARAPVMHGTANAQHRPVVRIDIERGTRTNFRTMTEAASTGFDIRGIYAACCGEQKTHRGYAWAYSDGPKTRSHNRRGEGL